MLHAAYAAAACWILAALLVRRGLRALPSLGDSPAAAPAGRRWPRVSIVVAARDEAEHIAAAVGSLLRLDYPDYEVVAVNDRSSDSTGPQLEALAHGSGRLRVAHVSELPPGWIGKSHALKRGVEAASGDWILFTDGDVRFRPETLRLAMAWALDRKVDLLTLWPRLLTDSLWMRAFYPAVLIVTVLALGLWARTSRRQSLVAVGAGAFLLVRRSAYNGCGGHEAIRLQVVDDVTLAQRVRAYGFRTEVLLAIDWLSVPWGTSVANYFHVTRKNAFAVFQFSWLLLLATTAAGLAVHVVLPLGWIAGLRFVPPAALSWVALAACYRAAAPRVGQSWLQFVLHPAVMGIIVVSAWSSALAVVREGGVHWRDSFYPLDVLKRAQRRRRPG